MHLSVIPKHRTKCTVRNLKQKTTSCFNPFNDLNLREEA
jgi:hypothetical protein